MSVECGFIGGASSNVIPDAAGNRAIAFSRFPPKLRQMQSEPSETYDVDRHRRGFGGCRVRHVAAAEKSRHPGVDHREIGKTHPPRGRGHGRGERVVPRPRAGHDAIPQRQPHFQTRPALLVRQRQGDVARPGRRSRAALSRAAAVLSARPRVLRRGSAAPRGRVRRDRPAPGHRFQCPARARRHAVDGGQTRRTPVQRERPLDRRCVRSERASRPQTRLVAGQYRASHRRRLVALEGREGLGRPRAGGEIPEVGGRRLWHARHRDEPHHRRRLVGVVHSAQGRRCERGRGLRPAPGGFSPRPAAGSATGSRISS